MPFGQEKLGLAIITKLRADTGAGSLVELLGHTSTKLRIARDEQPVKGRTPYLGAMIFNSVPLVGADVTALQRARIHFKVYAAKDLTAIRIADRLEHLLHGRDEETASGTNVGFYDFSSADISTRQVRFVNRDRPDFDDDVDAWMILLEADAIWIDQPCPSP